MGQPHWGDSAANNPSAASHSADAQLKVSTQAYFSILLKYQYLIFKNVTLARMQNHVKLNMIIGFKC